MKSNLVELEKDLCRLVKDISDLSKKHGGLYIAAHTSDEIVEGTHSNVICTKWDKLDTCIQYWRGTNIYTENISKRIYYSEDDTNAKLKERIEELEHRIYLLQQ